MVNNAYTVAIYYTGKPSQLFDEKNIDWAPSINLGHGSAPRLSLSTDCYGRAARREKNKQRRTEREEISETMKAMPGAQTVLTATGTQAVLTVNEVESLVKSEAQHTKGNKELQQRCAQLENDSIK